MSAVTHVSSDEQRQMYQFEWGISRQELTRRNKSSSLPFWVPNDHLRVHQMRLLLAKGLTPANTEDEDTVDLVLEWLPPPDENGTAPESPGLTTVTIHLLPASCEATSSSSSVSPSQATGSATGLVQLSSPRVVVSPFIPPAVWKSVAVGELLRIRVELQFGLASVIDPVRDTVHSLWSSLSTSFSQILQSVPEVSGQDVRHRLHTAELQSRFDSVSTGWQSFLAGITETKPDTEAVPKALPTPWSPIPLNWSDRESYWTSLIQTRLGREEQTFLMGPEVPLSEAETDQLEQMGFHPEALIALYDSDPVLHKGLLIPEVARQRHLLVPSRMPEEKFWAVYFWKAACLATCTIEEEVETLVHVLNHTTPREKTEARSPPLATLQDHPVDTEVRSGASRRTPPSASVSLLIEPERVAIADERRAAAGRSTPVERVVDEEGTRETNEPVEVVDEDQDDEFPHMPWEDEEL